MGSFGTTPQLNNTVPNDEMIERTLVYVSRTILAHSTSQLWTRCRVSHRLKSEKQVSDKTYCFIYEITKLLQQ